MPASSAAGTPARSQPGKGPGAAAAKGTPSAARATSPTHPSPAPSRGPAAATPSASTPSGASRSTRRSSGAPSKSRSAAAGGAAPEETARSSKKERNKMPPPAAPSAAAATSTTAIEQDAYVPYSVIASGSVPSHPPTFSHDGDFFFLPVGAAVKVYSRQTGEVVSTLRIPARGPGASGSSSSSSAAHAPGAADVRVTCLALHPLNVLRLIGGCSDGSLRVWDYLSGRLLQVLPVQPGLLISHLAVCGAPAYAERRAETLDDCESQAEKDGLIDLRNWAFVVLQKRKIKQRRASASAAASTAATPNGDGAGVGDAASSVVDASQAGAGSTAATGSEVDAEAGSSEERENSLIYAVHLRYSVPGSGAGGSQNAPAPPATIRLGKTRGAAAGLQASADGRFLVCIANKKLQVALLERLLTAKLAASAAERGNATAADSAESSGKGGRRGRGRKGGADAAGEGAGANEGFVKIATTSQLTCLALPHDPEMETVATGDEHGVIRLWHGCLDEEMLTKIARDEQSAAAGQRRSGAGASANASSAGAGAYLPSSTLHWHAHGVASLTWSANDAALLSGGEEAVLVVWQIGAAGGASGNQTKKEFVPRLRAPIAAVEEVAGYEGREGEYVVAFRDGSVTFISAINLKPSRTIARIRTDPTRFLLPESQRKDLPAPLAIEPVSGALVLAGSHPSELQFYDAAADRLLYELEVTPSNRVSRPDEAFIEPVRVQHVAFAPAPPSAKGAAAALGMSPWLAALETRQGGEGVSKEMALTFWQARNVKGTTRYELISRIHKPHDKDVTAMAFSPRASAVTGHPVLATASYDGSVRIWQLSTTVGKGDRREVYWSLSAVFSYRDNAARELSFAPDGALLAVAHGSSVTIWDVASSAMRLALLSPDIKSFYHVCIGGRAGRYVAASSGMNAVVWDLVTQAPIWRHAFAGSGVISQIWTHGRQRPGFVFALDEQGDSDVKLAIFDPQSCKLQAVGRLPFSLRAAAPLPARDTQCPALRAITDSFDLVDIGEQALSAHSSDATRSLHTATVTRRTLFEDLFGELEIAQPAATLPALSAKASSSGVMGLFSAPSHLLPSMGSLFNPFLEAVLPRRLTEEQSAGAAAKPTADAAQPASLPSQQQPAPSLQSIAAADLSQLTETFREVLSVAPPAAADTPSTKGAPKVNGSAKRADAPAATPSKGSTPAKATPAKSTPSKSQATAAPGKSPKQANGKKRKAD